MSEEGETSDTNVSIMDTTESMTSALASPTSPTPSLHSQTSSAAGSLFGDVVAPPSVDDNSGTEGEPSPNPPRRYEIQVIDQKNNGLRCQKIKIF